MTLFTIDNGAPPVVEVALPAYTRDSGTAAQQLSDRETEREREAARHRGLKDPLVEYRL